MARNRCPHCARKMPYAGRRCVHCGWSVLRQQGLDEGKGVAWWRRRGLWSVMVAGLLLVGIHYGYRNAPLLADWYASFAAENLPAGASSLAPTDTEDGAYFYCARQVSKRMRGDYSVETFPSQQESELTRLGDGKYQVESFVDETRLDGQRVRYSFVCTAAFDGGRWTLEKLDITERFATGAGQGPALAASR
ncbi:MAG TPA: hypothetical protein VFZ18_15820 [Longimicrobiaceae bacterium]